MSTLEELIADCIEEVTDLKVDPEILYFKFKGRNFRALVHEDLNQLQIDDEEFDRWANSVGGFVCPCPITSDAMKKAIDFLLNVHVLT